MKPDMLFLAERLVSAMETISQDVKNISAYVYDLSHNVSLFLNNKNKAEDISVQPCNECGSLPRDPPPFGAGEYSLRCEQINGSSMPHTDNVQHEEMSVWDVGTINNVRGENTEVLALFTGGLKVEELPECEESTQSDDVENPCVHARNNERDSTIHITRCPEDHGSIPETQKVISACALEGHSVHYCPEDTDRVDGKLLRGYMNDSEEPHQESCRAAGASSSSSELKLIHDGKEKEEQREMSISAGERCYGAQKKKKASAKKSHSGQSGKQKWSRGPFRCDTCGKCFRSKFHLEVHERIHTGERPFLCALCNKTCFSKSHLMVHMRVHSEERPYKCSTCDKSFKRKSTLKIHIRLHSGEKPFFCTVCAKSFTHSSTLKCHMRQHSGEKPFICTQCGKAFTGNSNLRTHMHTHTGEHPFTCEDCGSSFTQTSNLKRHRRIVHGVAYPVS